MASAAGPLGGYLARFATNQVARKFARQAAEEAISGAMTDGVEKTTGYKVTTAPPSSFGGLFGAVAYRYGSAAYASSSSPSSAPTTPSASVTGGYQAQASHLSKDGVFVGSTYSPSSPVLEAYRAQLLQSIKVTPKS